MGVDELTQKFRLKGEIAPKDKPTERWRIIEIYDTYCYVKKVNDNGSGYIDYDVLDRYWMPYKRTSKKVIPTFVIDNFNNEIRVGDTVHYATGDICGGRTHEIKIGVVTGFTEKKVVLDTGAYVEPCKVGKVFVKEGELK